MVNERGKRHSQGRGDGFERRKDGEHLKTEKRETEQRRGEEEPSAVVGIAASTVPPSRPAATPP